MGQNFMVDSSVYPKLAAYASLNATDVVLDAGAGFGFLTLFLAPKCKQVIAVEKDPQIAGVLREQTQTLSNVALIEGDVLKVAVPAFNKAISIPPYYLSSDFVLWLLNRAPECAVLILQKEFALRLSANVGDESYSWLSVVLRYRANIELLDNVPNWMFYPQPEVDSVIVRLKPWSTLPFKVNDEVFFRRLVRWLFTQRNKKLSNALTPFLRNEHKLDKATVAQITSSLPLREKRVRDLSPENFGEIANALTKQTPNL
ncbi:MAG: 16S rRNA (adenine(1518)-N(6)/adenine(1519)-N(6))-dimethyltransferase RsmA [Candidatus Bathyarchaeota archaeon]|nr:16S rRNA (adenine(1518)-N(6)/adenine(1519)-N(6))-dimethyltransferase RsmA [Candidatus Bathyarchaeota archaeon]